MARENSLDWHIYFRVDMSCPSGLRWDIDIYDSRGRLTKARKGLPAGSLDGRGRWQVQVHQEVYSCASIVYIMTKGRIPEGKFVDHKDGNTLNQSPSNLRAVSQAYNNKNTAMKGNNTSGKTGVGYWMYGKGEHARAYWVDSKGKMQSKTYSVRKYGREEAFKLASEHRDKMIAKLNEAGAGYTERHGYE